MLPKVNISLAEGSMRRLFPHPLVLSPFQIIIWLQLAKNGTHTSNECTSDKWSARSPFPCITKCWSQLISSVPDKNGQVCDEARAEKSRLKEAELRACFTRITKRNILSLSSGHADRFGSLWSVWEKSVWMEVNGVLFRVEAEILFQCF